TPVGRQLASGSSLDKRSLVSFAAHGCIGSASPFGRAPLISTTRGRSVPQTPERSGLPSAVRGAGPAGALFLPAPLAAGAPAAAAGGVCPAAGETPYSNSAAETAIKLKVGSTRGFLTCVSSFQEATSLSRGPLPSNPEISKPGNQCPKAILAFDSSSALMPGPNNISKNPSRTRRWTMLLSITR